MSGKSARIVKKETVRTMDDINKEYSELIGKVGQAQYQAFVYTTATQALNKEIERVNNEAARRMALDAAKEKSQTDSTTVETTKEGTNV